MLQRQRGKLCKDTVYASTLWNQEPAAFGILLPPFHLVSQKLHFVLLMSEAVFHDVCELLTRRWPQKHYQVRQRPPNVPLEHDLCSSQTATVQQSLVHAFRNNFKPFRRGNFLVQPAPWRWCWIQTRACCVQTFGKYTVVTVISTNASNNTVKGFIAP